MDLVKFYQSVLKPPFPWHVSKVEMDDTENRVDVWLEHEPGFRFMCPLCGNPYPLYDHAEERTWQHLDTCGCPTYLHARLPRVSCPEHGVRNGDFGMAEPGSGLTCELEAYCINLLKACPIQDASRIAGLSWDMLHGVEERAVRRGLSRRGNCVPKTIGIDEKQVFARHKYFTIITDLTHGHVIDVLDKRTLKDITPWFREHRNELANVKKIAMDMSAGYASLAASCMSGALVCFDHFHLKQVMQKAVDETRKEEQAALPEEMRKTMFGGRYLFLYNQENIPEKRVAEFEELRKLAVKTSRAWAIKEAFSAIWKECRGIRDEARKLFEKWFWWATHSRLKHVAKAAHTLKRHLEGMLNAIENNLSNAVTEGLNQKIETLKREACGFRNKDSFRTAILFRCGGLDMSPENY